MAQMGIIGDINSFDLPEIQNDRQALIDERNLAKFSKSREYKALREYLTVRIAYYQAYLPGGIEYAHLLANGSLEELGAKTVIGNTLVGEFQAIIRTYESAADAVKEADKNG